MTGDVAVFAADISATAYKQTCETRETFATTTEFL